MSSFPTANLNDAQVYIALLAAELVRYPGVVAAAAIRRLIRTAPFLPSVSEVVTACEGLVASSEAVRAERVRKQLAEREAAEKPVDPGERERVIAGFKELQQLLRSTSEKMRAPNDRKR